MSRYIGLSETPHARPARTGVLMVMLGSPTAPTAKAVRRFLREFLSDPRVVELPRALWLMILYCFVLPFRPRRVAKAYESVWQAEGSPLTVITQRQAQGLAQRLDGSASPSMAVQWAMRYGEESIEKGLLSLRDQGVERLIVLPMYPQYSATTTASVFDAVSAALQRWRWMPELRCINQYMDEPGYIDALARSVREHWDANGRGERLLMSFHGIPEQYWLDGDPYPCHCFKTARLLAEALNLDDGAWACSFQSRFGKAKWVEPATDSTLQSWGADGVGDVDVICPGFAADCLETLEEIAIANAEGFRGAGGGTLRYIPALNDRDDHVDALAQLLVRHAGGWPDDAAARADGEERAQRAAHPVAGLGR